MQEKLPIKLQRHYLDKAMLMAGFRKKFESVGRIFTIPENIREKGIEEKNKTLKKPDSKI